MWWHPVDNVAERGRATCGLLAPDGSKQTLSQRLQARGAMDLQCNDLDRMHTWHVAQGTLLPPLKRPAAAEPKAEL